METKTTEDKKILEMGYDYAERLIDFVNSKVENDQRLIVGAVGLIPPLLPLTFAAGKSVKLTFWAGALTILNLIMLVISSIPFVSIIFFPLAGVVTVACSALWIYGIIYIFKDLLPSIDREREREKAVLIHGEEWVKENYDKTGNGYIS